MPVLYDFTNVGITSQFIKDNIVSYNLDSRDFTFKKYKAYYKSIGKSDQDAHTLAAPIPTGTIFEIELRKNLYNIICEVTEQEKLNNELADIKETKLVDIESKLIDIANKFILSKKDLLKYYENYILKKIQTIWQEKKKYQESFLHRVLAYNEYIANTDRNYVSQSESTYINNSLKKSVIESVDLILDGGFLRHMYDVNTGVGNGTTRSNEGDAAQFLFLARAILAGFSCSNVDVRTSPYDAVIDYKNYLLRIQIKGISNNAISFVTSPRGGAGSDTSAPTNVSRDITEADCDIYVAVDKTSGTCYIIPIDDVRDYLDRGKKSLPKRDWINYKEKWSLIEKKAKNRFRL